ncbi:phosphopantetheine-binding protein [uncultured Planktomarina sp.]|jgi:acyl carrier protein|uniref:acyl carrier protein n=1 Tax=uncultured Planktomarina sp. TaxID=1538529 RepID=UPI000C8EE5B1|nr:phosphopantetheine-binding protein [Paracoccaceae bacterium]MBT4895037.1 acyl carrier protein [Paracoccaceae bacterium]MBT6522743.1 acyl carrier protein [Paracoccaceae bacterium]MBT7342834.1 acyl carrier protein [Paracoccaceae bacterium]|tara:strand:- start:174 stop:431 length:258 start_codon:yes stop_codon:yes gene_type:complete
MSVKDKVILIIAEQGLLDVADVSLSATLEDLGIDSLGVVESIFAIEEEFDIEVPFNANAPEESEFDISSVATIISAVETLVAEQT